MRTPPILSAVITCLLVAVGCSESSGPKVVPIATVSIVGNPTTLQLGSSVTVSAQAKDADGAILTGRTFSWSSTSNSIASVGPDGTITGLSVGQVQITATSEGKSGAITLNIIPVPVANVTVSLASSQISVGQTTQATATIVDALGRPLQGRPIAWSSSQPSVAAVNPTSGLVTGTGGGGPVSIIATVEGVTGSAALFVSAVVSCTSTLQLFVGERRLLSGAERSSFCVSAAGASEYVLIPFNASPVAAASASFQLSGANTVSPTSASILTNTTFGRAPMLGKVDDRSIELAFRARERDELTPALRSFRSRSRARDRFTPSAITGIPADPTIGAIFPMNVRVTGDVCTSAKQLRDARVAAVTPKVIVLIDTQAPAGGYTDDELRGFAETFEQFGLPVDTLNFGSPTDIDSNNRFVILFTGSVNALSGTSGGIVGGLQASRDLFPASVCQASNEGEMFYMPVPDPNSVINGTYTNKAEVSRRVQATLAHELQHLINAGRRIYVNDADDFEEVWLNEGLSHIAEELVYYQVSGNTRGMNIGLPRVQSSQAQLDAVNVYQVQNLGRLITYLRATESNSPYADNDKLETRGSTWQLLRYAADRTGGDERSIWRAMANSKTIGQAVFNAAFGSITAMTRDFAITQYLDDTTLPATPAFAFPSWNFRSLLPALNSGVFPLATRTLLTNPLDVTLVAGGASYVKFGVAAGASASVSASAAGQAPAASVEFTLIRTQ